MKTLSFSFIVPVYNRPEEVRELLSSFLHLETDDSYEIVIVEDGSTKDSKSIVNGFSSALNISYYTKKNSGPGESRNFGMRKAKGDYFIILDSDVILPSGYLHEVREELQKNYVDCFGGPDAAHHSFTSLQKAINFAMTSFISTGGIRGGKKQLEKFQPRSFNMGISRAAFEASQGFGSIHPGEDPDLSIRLWELGYITRLFPKAFVFHKRRVSWKKFSQQVHKFGLVRPILNYWHPKTRSLIFWLPTIFSLGLITAILLSFVRVYIPICIYLVYFFVAFVMALRSTKNITVSLKSILAIIVQFFGYGYGFFRSTLAVGLMRKEPKSIFPFLFFETK